MHFGAVPTVQQRPGSFSQLREAFPFDTAPRYAILDRDGNNRSGSAPRHPEHGRETGEEASTITPAESVCGAVRRNLAPRVLDKIIVFNQRPASPRMAQFVPLLHEDRVTWSGEDTPELRVVTPQPSPLLGW